MAEAKRASAINGCHGFSPEALLTCRRERVAPTHDCVQPRLGRSFAVFPLRLAATDWSVAGGADGGQVAAQGPGPGCQCLGVLGTTREAECAFDLRDEHVGGIIGL